MRDNARRVAGRAEKMKGEAVLALVFRRIPHVGIKKSLLRRIIPTGMDRRGAGAHPRREMLHGLGRDVLLSFAKKLTPVVLAVDNLPAEFPGESSMYFSGVLMNYVPDIAKADFSVPFGNLQLPDVIKRAVILHNGKFTPDFEYMKEYVK